MPISIINTNESRMYSQPPLFDVVHRGNTYLDRDMLTAGSFCSIIEKKEEDDYRK